MLLIVSRFVNNTADVLGGAISHTGSRSDRLAIAGSTFSGNGAGELACKCRCFELSSSACSCSFCLRQFC